MSKKKLHTALPSGRVFALLASFFLIASAFLPFGGCGGGRDTISTTGGNQTASSREGSVRLNVAWPERSRLIPDAASSIVIEVTAPAHPSEGVIRREVRARPEGGGVLSVTMEKLPEVTLRIAVHTAPEADGNGTPLSTGVGEVLLTPADRVKTVDISLTSTIATVVATPDALTLSGDEPQRIEVQAKDSGGRIVMTRPERWEWTGEGPVTVAASGLSASITATGSGAATVRIRETESGVSVTVPVRIVPNGEGGDIVGVVTAASTGLPVEGVRVETAGTEGLWEARTDATGRYRLEDVAEGNRVVSFAFCGLRTDYEITVASGGEVTLNAALETAETVFDAPPVISFDEPVVDEERGTAVISGNIANTDTGEAVLLLNGNESLISVASDGSFRHVGILVPGANLFRVRATNCKGTVISDERRVDFVANYFFRTTLEWDGPGDVDLYTWSPTGERSYYGRKVIATGELDVDNVTARGPENFTNRVATPGRYEIGVNAFSGSVGRHATVKVAVFGGPNAGRVYSYGPYLFTQNSTGSGPVGNTASWWRPVDVIIGGDGSISVDEPSGRASRGRFPAPPPKK